MFLPDFHTDFTVLLLHRTTNCCLPSASDFPAARELQGRLCSDQLCTSNTAICTQRPASHQSLVCSGVGRNKKLNYCVCIPDRGSERCQRQIQSMMKHNSGGKTHAVGLVCPSNPGFGAIQCVSLYVSLVTL